MQIGYMMRLLQEVEIGCLMDKDTKMKKSNYIFPMIPIMYGVLTLNGIHIPRINPDDGKGWLIYGILLLLGLVISDYLIYKGIIKTGYEEIEPRKPIDILCVFLFVLGMTYFIVYLFKLHMNDWIFGGVLLIFAFCGKSVAKS